MLQNDMKLVNELKILGLTQYEAQAFIALAKLGSADATTISKVSDVPKSKIYGIMTLLEERKIVSAKNIGKTKPRSKVYRILSIKKAIEILKSPVNEAAEFSQKSLEKLYSSKEKFGTKVDVWTVKELENIQLIAQKMINSTTEEILGMVTLDLFPELIESLKKKKNEVNIRFIMTENELGVFKEKYGDPEDFFSDYLTLGINFFQKLSELPMINKKIDFKHVFSLTEKFFESRPSIIITDPSTEETKSLIFLKHPKPNKNAMGVQIINKNLAEFQYNFMQVLWEILACLK